MNTMDETTKVKLKTYIDKVGEVAKKIENKFIQMVLDCPLWEERPDYASLAFLFEPDPKKYNTHDPKYTGTGPAICGAEKMGWMFENAPVSALHWMSNAIMCCVGRAMDDESVKNSTRAMLMAAVPLLGLSKQMSMMLTNNQNLAKEMLLVRHQLMEDWQDIPAKEAKEMIDDITKNLKVLEDMNQEHDNESDD